MSFTLGILHPSDEPEPTPPTPRRYPVTGQPLRSRTSFKDLTGKRYGRWLVVAEAPRTRSGQSRWQCRCDCGTTRQAVCYTSLTTGRSQSCGCLKSELSRKPLHEQIGHVNPTYRAWHAMKSRPNVCPEWRESFHQFLRDVGPRPERWVSSGVKHAKLLRLKESEGYNPANCRWDCKPGVATA